MLTKNQPFDFDSEGNPKKILIWWKKLDKKEKTQGNRYRIEIDLREKDITRTHYYPNNRIFDYEFLENHNERLRRFFIVFNFLKKCDALGGISE